MARRDCPRPEVRFGDRYIHDGANQYAIRVQIYLGALDPESVAVELYADGVDGGEPETVSMAPAGAIAGAVNGWIYQAAVDKRLPIDHYTPCIIPRHAEALARL
jgi:starch phosphorylase